MHASNLKRYPDRADQVFLFSIRDDSVTRASVTIFAEDIDAAWNRLHTLFPGWDLSDTEVKQTASYA